MPSKAWVLRANSLGWFYQKVVKSARTQQEAFKLFRDVTPKKTVVLISPTFLFALWLRM